MTLLDSAYLLPEAPYLDIVGVSLDRFEALLGSARAAGIYRSTGRRRGVQRFGERTRHLLQMADDGIRARLPAEMGDGVWDFFRISDDFYLSLTDAVYARQTDVNLPSEELLKIRILLEGELTLNFSERASVIGPGVCISSHPAVREDRYLIQPARPQRMAVLHCRRSLIDRLIAEMTESDPGAAMAFFDRATVVTMPLTTNLVQCVGQLYNPPVHDALSKVYRRAKSTELLCEVFDMLVRGVADQGGPNRSDDNAVVERARAILMESLRSPPTVEQLARRIGVNQTKLKSAFRELVGLPIYEFIQRERLRLACSMLANTSLTVSQIAFTVGYNHASNFSNAFSRQFGVSPREYRSRFELYPTLAPPGPGGFARLAGRG